MELDVLIPPGTTATVTLPGEPPCDAAPGRHRWTGPAPEAMDSRPGPAGRKPAGHGEAGSGRMVGS